MENNTYQSKSQKIYASMAHMSSNVEILRRYFGDSSQLTNCSLDSGATCHMKQNISNFTLGSLVETDKYIEVADRHFETSIKIGEFQIKMRDDNGKPFIATLYNVLLSPDLCVQLFSNIMLMNSGHTCLFHKGFRTVFLSDKKQNASS